MGSGGVTLKAPMQDNSLTGPSGGGESSRIWKAWVFWGVCKLCGSRVLPTSAEHTQVPKQLDMTFESDGFKEYMYTNIYIYIYIYMCVCVCVCM